MRLRVPWPWRRQSQDKARPPVGQSARTYQPHPWQGVLGGFEPAKLLSSYKLYDAAVEALPFLDVGLRKFTRLIDGFSVEADNDSLKEAANGFLATVRHNEIQQGFASFEYRYTRSLLTYGRSIGEILPVKSGREIYQLINIDAAKVRLTRGEDGGILIGEDDGMGSVKPYENQDLILYNLINGEKDSLFGVSLLRSIPWIADCLLIMQNSIRQQWQRQGAPALAFIDKVPETAQINASGLAARREAVQEVVKEGAKKRWEQQGIIDFVVSTQGDFIVTTIGGDMHELNFEAPWRAVQEQIVSSIELAPFLLGLQWSTTERLSQQQADAIISSADAVRSELESAYMTILQTWQALTGQRGELQAEWEPVTLQDVVETAKAEVYQAKAQNDRTKAAMAAWRNGWIDQEQAAAEAGYELEEMAEPMDSPPSAPSFGGPGGEGGGFGEESYAAKVRQWWEEYPAGGAESE